MRGTKYYHVPVHTPTLNPKPSMVSQADHHFTRILCFVGGQSHTGQVVCTNLEFRMYGTILPRVQVYRITQDVLGIQSSMLVSVNRGTPMYTRKYMTPHVYV